MPESLTAQQPNDNVVFVLPDFDPLTGYLPTGVHAASWQEIRPRFGTNMHRSQLVDGLERALRRLADAGCQSVLIDGSFVSAKPLPNDYDVAWYPTGVDPDRVDNVLLDMSNRRAAMKAKYGGEFFSASKQAAPGTCFRDFFQTDREGLAKGVVEVDLGTLG